VRPLRLRRPAAAVLAGAATLAGCGGGERPRPTPEDDVRAAARAYLGALAARDWPEACELMTETARHDLADATGTSCARALSSGAALAAEELASARREVAGAGVSIRGRSATLGPLGGARQSLRLRRVAGRWLVTS
jgi:hypothetical protein